MIIRMTVVRSFQNLTRRILPTVLRLVITLVAVFILGVTVPNEKIKTDQFRGQTQEKDSLIQLTFVFAGDAMAHLPQTQAAYDTASGIYKYQEVLQWMSPVIKSSDLAVVNLETTLAGPPYKGYPQFSAPDNYALHLSESGFNLFCCANNHSLDRYNQGVIRTIEVLDSFGIIHTGTFPNQTERDSLYPCIMDIKGVRIAVLNATYGTNGIPLKEPVQVNLIDKQQLRSDIVRAHEANPDIIIAVMHWGDEYKPYPNAFQKDIAAFLAGEGVDIIVGHHPHVLQPVEWIKAEYNGKQKDVLVIWSLGNFLSNQRSRYRDGGMVVKVHFVMNRYTNEMKIENPGYYPFWVWKGNLPGGYRILPAELRDSLIELYTLTSGDKVAFDTFISDARGHLRKNGTVREYCHYIESTPEKIPF